VEILMTMRAETMSNIQRRARALGIGTLLRGAAFCAAAALLSACGSSGSDLSCGKGTEQKGSTCVAKQPIVEADASAGGGGGSDAGGGAGGSSAGGVGTGGNTATGGNAGDDGGGAPKDVIEFDGVTSAAPGAQTPEVVKGAKKPPADSVRLAWAPAKYPAYPLATLRYEIYAATAAGMENFEAPIAEAPPGATSFLVQGLDAKKMFFVVRTVANEGGAKDENKKELSATPSYDDTKPTFSGGVKVASATSTSVTLTWKPGTDDTTPAEGLSYQVYWGVKSGSTPTLGAISLPGQTTATVTGLPAPKTEFFFRVLTVDAAGNTSDNDDDSSGKTGADGTAPVFGGCSSASNPTAGGAVLEWSPAVDDTTLADDIQYEVYAFEVPVTRDTPFDKLTPVATFKGGTKGEVTGLKNGTSYRVVCRAVDSSGNHDDNRVTQAFTTKLDGKAPTFDGPATDPKSYIVDSTTIQLTWPQATDDQSHDDRIVYYVYVATKPGEEDFTSPPLVKTDPGVLGAPVPELLSNTQYYFIVRAVDEAGNIDQNTSELGLVTLVSFQGDVQPIFTQNCALSGCHIPGNPPQGQILQDGYAYNSIVDKLAGEGSTVGDSNLKRIDSTSPDPTKSYLWRKISGTLPLSGSTMPPDGSNKALSADQKETIRLWIVQGAKEN
jgi:hypothetical protein